MLRPGPAEINLNVHFDKNIKALTPKAALRPTDFSQRRTAIVIWSGPESPYLASEYRNRQYDGNQSDEYARERVTHENTERAVRKYQ